MDPRALLEQDRSETEARLAALRADLGGVMAASRDTNADDEHDPEGHTIAFERAQTLALASQAERHLVEIDAALDRWDRGSWGSCERCRQPIPEMRLRARPTARTCISCAQAR